MKLESINDYILQEDLNNLVRNNRIPKELYNNSVLVSGATGLVGSQLIKALLCSNRLNNSNIKIIGLARNPKKVNKVFKDCLDREDLIIEYSDINSEINIEEPIDYIIHGASITSSKIFISKPVEVIKTALDGTYNLLELAKKKKVKSFVYISSMEMYGTFDATESYANESQLGRIDILNVRSCYSEGKRMCENLCVCFAQEYKVPIKIARLSQTFGSGVNKDETRVFAQFAKSVINEQNIVLNTKGESWGNYCYTSDAVAALLLILTRGKNSEAYNVSNENTNIMIKDMAKLVASEIANDKIKVIINFNEDSSSFGYAPDVKLKLNSNKLTKLGWESTYDLKEMYERLIKSFRIQMED